MEALATLGIAANVLQFLQFSGQLISEALIIKRTGSPSSAPELKKYAVDLTKLASEFKTPLDAKMQVGELSQNEKILHQAARECQETGDEFVAYLDTWMDNASTSNSATNIFRSATKSCKFKLAYKKIERFETKLGKLRDALTTATLVNIQNNAQGYNKKVLAALHEGNKGLQQLVAAQAGSEPLLCRIQEQVNRCLGHMEKLMKEFELSRSTAILKWLNFREVPWRYDEVALAYQTTFRWVFQDPSATRASWDNFTEHLQAQETSGPYFIDGKAGSGKSTLMKFLVDSPQTKDALRQWAGSSGLLMANFFFWNLGTRRQKSQEGMLRSLLYAVLKEEPRLIPSVFPHLWGDWRESEFGSEPKLIELKRAFELMRDAASKYLKICIFIDGVDEIEGDYRDLSTFLRSLVSSHVKLVVSSRPINACIHAFQGCPTLKVQELTKPDMRLYVKANLAEHQSMVELAQRYPENSKALISDITEKADGVFLWVKIVVRLLVDGLEDGDDIEDLRKKLQSLPPDLRDLYKRMISKMEPHYRVQAAEIFQMVHLWKEVSENQPLATLVLSLAMDGPSEALARPVGPLDNEQAIWRCQRTENKIRSRCCGLIEVHKKLDRPGGESSERPDASPNADRSQIRDSVINYLHRTVAEFLMAQDVWAEICAATEDSKFDPAYNLTSACLSMMKVQDNLQLSTYFTNSMAILRKAKRLSAQTMGRLVDEVEQTMCLRQSTACDLVSSDGENHAHWQKGIFRIRPFLHPLSVNEDVATIGNSLTLAAREALFQYLRTAYGSSDSHTPQSLTRYALLAHALESWRNDPQRVSLHDRLETLNFLFTHVAHPEDPKFGSPIRRYIRDVAQDLLAKSRTMDCAVLIREVFIATRRPEVLTATWGLDNPAETVRLSFLLQKFHEDIDPDINSLGDEIMKLTSPKSSTADGPRQARDAAEPSIQIGRIRKYGIPASHPAPSQTRPRRANVGGTIARDGTGLNTASTERSRSSSTAPRPPTTNRHYHPRFRVTIPKSSK